jgi:hypothetical protein
MLKNTDHPTSDGEFYATYTRALEDILRRYRGVVVRRGGAYSGIRTSALELALADIGYYRDPEVPQMRYQQSGFEGAFPLSWLQLPTEIFAKRIADLGIEMSNRRLRGRE